MLAPERRPWHRIPSQPSEARPRGGSITWFRQALPASSHSAQTSISSFFIDRLRTRGRSYRHKDPHGNAQPCGLRVMWVQGKQDFIDLFARVCTLQEVGDEASARPRWQKALNATHTHNDEHNPLAASRLMLYGRVYASSLRLTVTAMGVL